MTEDGRLLYKGDDWEPFYTGKCFPETNYDQSPISVDLLVRGRGQGNNCETLQLPFFEPQLRKSLERLGIKEESQYSEVGVRLCNCDVSERLKDFIVDFKFTVNDLTHLNKVAHFLGEMPHNNGTELMKMVDITSTSSLEELGLLAKHYDEFDFYSEIESPKEFGEYLLEQACDTDFGWKLSEYMDYEGFGESQLEDLAYVFTENGLLTYSGNQLDLLSHMEKMEQENQMMGGMYQ